MKRNMVIKGICSVVFVAVAGIFYLGASGNSITKEGAQVILQGEDIVQDTEEKEAKEVKEAGNLGEETIQNSIYVHICGAVNTPGVYQLPAGSRIADAVIYAGDFSPDAAKDYLNLARLILDGEKIYVPNKEEAEQILEGKSPIGMGESGENLSGEKLGSGEISPVNLNTAGVDELMTLPGIGRAKADAILSYRNEHPFSSCEELMQVPGIKQSVYEKIRDNITVGN